MRTLQAVIVALITAVAAASPAIAEMQGGAVTISPFAGAHVYDHPQRLGPSVSVGTRLGFNLDENWGVESQVTYAQPRRNGLYGNLYNIGGDILYHLNPKGPLVPFLALGGGWLHTNYIDRAVDDTVLDYGAGLKYFLHDTLALRWDFRHVFAFHRGPVNGADYWQNFEITAGISFQFGSAQKPVPAVEHMLPTPAPSPVPSPEATKPVQEPPAMQPEKSHVSGKTMIDEIHTDEDALELIAGTPIRKYKVFTLSQPSRLVIDITDADSELSGKTVRVDRLGIATARFESHPEYLRIIFDAAHGRLIPYRIQETERGLKIIVTKPGPED